MLASENGFLAVVDLLLVKYNARIGMKCKVRASEQKMINYQLQILAPICKYVCSKLVLFDMTILSVLLAGWLHRGVVGIVKSSSSCA